MNNNWMQTAREELFYLLYLILKVSTQHLIFKVETVRYGFASFRSYIFQIFHDGGHAFACSVPPNSVAVADLRLMSGDTKALARSQDGSLRTWNLADGKMVR